MALDLEITSLDGLDDAVKGLYIANGNGFKLDVLGIPTAPTDNSGLVSALEKERLSAKTATKELKELKKKFAGLDSKYKDIDVDKYTEMAEAVKKAEEEALIADGKKDEVFAAKLEESNSVWQREVDAQKSLLDETSESVKSANARIEALQQKALEGAILNGINGVFHKEANEDAVMLAKTLFKLNEDNVAVWVDDLGNETLPKDWANSAELKAKKPHWYLSSGSGGGATQGGSATPSGTKTITRTQYEALSPTNQRATYKSGVKIIDG